MQTNDFFQSRVGIVRTNVNPGYFPTLMSKTKNKARDHGTRSNLIIDNGRVSFRKDKRYIVHAELLSEDEWKRILPTSSLPTDARVRISSAISVYRNKVAANRGSLSTKRSVLRARNSIRKLLTDSKILLNDPTFFEVGLPAWSSRTGPKPDDLTERLQIVEELDQILADAQDRMQLQRGRKSPKPLYDLIQQLTWIAADATGLPSRRSTKVGSLRPTNRYILACTKIADPSLSESTINNALTKFIAEHSSTLKKHGFDIAIGKSVK